MDQLLVALDVDTRERALELADLLRGTAGGSKIGSRLFTSEGPSLVSTLADRGDRVFLDLKYHDIPTVVAEAVRAAARLGTWMLTVHAASGRAMLEAEADAARQTHRRPLVVGVTVLTSLDGTELARIGVDRALPDQVEALADLAIGAGLDGVVASPPASSSGCARVSARRPTIITPGIRGGAGAGQSDGDDQVRTLSAAEAMSAGATYIVVGRPIIASPDPLASAKTIVRQLEEQSAHNLKPGMVHQPAKPMHLTLYTRPGCHLCDDLKEILLRVRRRQAFELREVDISGDPALERRYGHDIPVLLLDGVETARHRIDEADLIRRLTRAQAG